MDNCDYLTSKNNYHIENIKFIKIDYAYERIYITFFYEDYSQQTIMLTTHSKGYLEDIQTKEKQGFCEVSEKHFRVLLNDKEIINFVI